MTNSTKTRRGIRRVNHRFEARIAVDGKRKSLGFFDTVTEAYEAYRLAKTGAIDSKPVPFRTLKQPLTAERLREVLDYSPETGIFLHKGRSGVVAGTVAGTVKPDGYRQIRVDCRKYYAAPLAWLYVTGEWPEFQIDHEDGNRDNNKFGNFRSATRAENLQNTALRTNNTTGFHGVSWHAAQRKYVARIMVDRKSIGLGYFHTPEEAHAAYLAAKERLHAFQPKPRDLP